MALAAVPGYLGSQFDSASPGLRFGMYLQLWCADGSRKTTAQAQALERACRFNEADQQRMAAMQQRQAAMAAALPGAQLLFLDAVTTAPFTTGLGNEHPLENGFSFLNPHGLPYLPGSGIKGVLRQAATELSKGCWEATQQENWEAAWIEALFGSMDPDQPRRGALQFWDAFPAIPGNRLAVDIMAPHQKHYYQGEDSPHDSGSPIPIFFLTVPPGSNFAFHVICDTELLCHTAPELASDSRWQEPLTAAFEHAFAWLGFGAKTAVGYGAMETPAMAERRHHEHLVQEQELKRKKEEALAVEREKHATPWEGARIRFNRNNKSLSVEKNNEKAIALAPQGEILLASLPKDTRAKIERGQFVRVTAYVADHVLVRVEP